MMTMNVLAALNRATFWVGHRNVRRMVRFGASDPSSMAMVRRNAFGVLSFFSGELDSAVRAFLVSIQHDSTNREALTNLGYLISHVLDDNRAASLHGPLRALWAADALNVNLVRIYSTLLLRLDPDAGASFVDTFYLDKVIRPAVRLRPRHPMYLVHIPKCSGTSVAKALSIVIYGRSPEELLPQYWHLHLLKYCVERRMDRIPFMSSTHVPFWQVRPANDAFSFAIFRDPLKRLLSAYRQFHRSMRSGYHLRLIPRYGSHWNYWTSLDLLSWMASVPPSIISAHLSAFSSELDRNEAVRLAKELDYPIMYDRQVGSVEELLSLSRLPLGIEDVPKDLNRSPERPRIDPTVMERARALLTDEYALLDALDSRNDVLVGAEGEAWI